MSKCLCIAIDGPAGSGKSTISHLVAEKLKLVHLDTGAMYRAIGYKAIMSKIDLSDSDAIINMLMTTSIDVIFDNDNNQHMIIDNNDITDKIRTSEISRAASSVAVIPQVRIKLVELQRKIAESYPIILDGRDIGSYVLPNADLKIFLTASEEIRAKRRLNEQKEKGIECSKSLEQMVTEIAERDYRDSHREFAPLTVAKDAVVIDTSYMSIEEVCDKIIGIIRGII